MPSPVPSPTLFPSLTLLPGSGPNPLPAPGPFTQGVLNSAAPLTASSPDLTTYLTTLGEMFDEVYSIVADQGYAGDPDYIPGWSTLLDPNSCPAQFLPYLAQFNGTVVRPGTDETTGRAIIKGETGMKRGTPAAMQQAAMRNLTGWTTQLANTSEELGTITAPLPTNGMVTELPISPSTNLSIAGSIKVTSGSNSQTFVATGSTQDAISVVPQTPNYAYPAGSVIWGPWLIFRERIGANGTPDPYGVVVGYNPSECPSPAALANAVNAVKPAGILVTYVSSDGYTWNEATGHWSTDTMEWVQTQSTQP